MGGAAVPLIGLGVGIAGSYFGSQAQSNAAQAAANSNADATQAGIAAQMYMYNQARQDYMPYYNLGLNAVTPVSDRQWRDMRADNSQNPFADYIGSPVEQRPEMLTIGRNPRPWSQAGLNSLSASRRNSAPANRTALSYLPNAVGQQSRAIDITGMTGTMTDINPSTGMHPTTSTGSSQFPSLDYPSVTIGGNVSETSFGGAPTLSPFERLAYQRDQGTTNALSAYQQYRGQNLPGANLSINLPGSNISMDQDRYLVDTNQAKVDPQKYSNINTSKYYVDPNRYKADASDVLDFHMSETDPVYRWKMERAKKNALSNLSAAGLTGSKYGMSAMQEAAMGVMSDEVDKQYGRALDRYGINYQTSSDLYNRTADQQNLQYGRDYTKETDLYNRTAEQRAVDWNRQFSQNSALYDRVYGLKSDNFNRGYQNAMAKYQVSSDNYNRAFQNASYTDNLRMNQMLNSYNMNNSLAQQDYAHALDAVQIGAGAAGSAGNWGMSAGGNAAQLYQNIGAANANAATAQGNAMANFYSGLGAAPMNAMAMYYAGMRN